MPAHFYERTCSNRSTRDGEQPSATHAVCSEVLEHVDDPVALMRNAIALLAPGCEVVVTVPGGPRSAFDRYVGHLRHFTATLSNQVSRTPASTWTGCCTGFPFFNLYKLAVIARGRSWSTTWSTAHRAPSPPCGEGGQRPSSSAPSPSTGTTPGSAGRWAAVAHVPLVG